MENDEDLFTAAEPPALPPSPASVVLSDIDDLNIDDDRKGNNNTDNNIVVDDDNKNDFSKNLNKNLISYFLFLHFKIKVDFLKIFHDFEFFFKFIS